MQQRLGNYTLANWQVRALVWPSGRIDRISVKGVGSHSEGLPDFSYHRLFVP